MVSNIYLEKTLKYINGFVGVFAADQISVDDFNSSLPQYAVVNTKNISDTVVGHWLLLSRYEKDGEIILELYDSFAYPISILSENLKQVILNLDYDYFITNNVNVQHLSSQYCGIYCIGRILSLNNMETLSSHLKMFSLDLSQNDIILCDYIRDQNK